MQHKGAIPTSADIVKYLKNSMTAYTILRCLVHSLLPVDHTNKMEFNKSYRFLKGGRLKSEGAWKHMHTAYEYAWREKQ